MDSKAEKSVPTSDQLLSEIKRRKSRRDFTRLLYNTVASLVVVAALAVIISLLFLPVLRVTGTSMSPTLENEQLVVCSSKGSFKRGDIVAFYYNNKLLLKRVVAVSGEYVNIDPDGTVYVNNEPIDEPYLTEKAFGECDIELPYQVPDQRIFVMGDNRATSVDSRSTSVGCVSEESVLGKVVLRIWPLNTMSFVS